MLDEDKKLETVPEEEPVAETIEEAKAEVIEEVKEGTIPEVIDSEASEEIKDNPVAEEAKPEEVAPEIIDSEFSDEVKKSEVAPAGEKTEEAAEGEEKPGVNLYADESDVKLEQPKAETHVTKNAKGKDVVTYVYKDENLQKIEDARAEFYKVYRKNNTLKWVVALVGMVVVVAGWLIPNYIPGISSNSSLSFGITIAIAAVALIGILVYNSFAKKKNQAALDKYFKDYYDYNNAYVFGDKVTNMQGGVSNKLDAEVFKASDIYADVYKVGSRDCLSFELDGRPIIYSDAAAQIKGKKTLRTVFVGKFIAFDNNWKGGDILIYFKGNKRALPPTNLEGREVYSDKKNLVVYGGSYTKKFLTKPVREALAKFEMNATLVDLTVSVREGKTYVCMGYEDTLMVLPMEKPFNPVPTEQLGADTEKLFDFIRASWGKSKE